MTMYKNCDKEITKLKKIITLLLVLSLVVSLAACGSDENGNESKTSAESKASTDTSTASSVETSSGEPADEGGWPAAALAAYTEGKFEFPAFTGACSGFDVYDSENSINITCTDAETSDVMAYVNGLESVGFANRLFWLSDTVYLKVSYAGEMITVTRKDEAGKWPYNQILADLGYAADDIYGVSDYTFTYDKASHTVTCANADSDLYDKVITSFDNGNWDGTDEDNVFELYKRSDDYPTIFAAVTLNGSTLTVVFTVS